PETSIASASLRHEMTSDQCGIRTHRNEVTQPLRKQSLLQIASSRIERVGQPAPVVVASLLARMQPDLATAGLDQGLQSAPGRLRKGLGTATLPSELRRVEAYQANAATIGQAQRIAIDHLCDLLSLQRTGWRTGCRRSHGKTHRHQ